MNYELPFLLNEDFIFNKISNIGFKERYTKGKTPHSIHPWWARRPYLSMRVLIFSCLYKGEIDKGSQLMEQMLLDQKLNSSLQKKLQEVLSRDGKYPSILDPFSGGGTIPLESVNLGLNSYSVDANILSVFIQKILLEFPSKLSMDEVIHHTNIAGVKLLNKLKQQTKDLYPHRNRSIIGYIWSYRGKCTNCEFSFLVSNRPWLDKKKKKNNYLALKVNKNLTCNDVEIISITKENAKNYSKLYRKNSVVATKQCPNCWSEINLDVNHFTDEILVEIKKERVGKSFSISDQNLPTNLNSIEQRLLGELSYLSEDFIDIPKWSGITNLTIYGLTEYINFLNQRQRIIVLLLLKSLHKEFELIKEEKGEPMAKVVIGLLSGLVDQLVDWNSRITMWISQNQQVGRSLSGPGIPMYWDYVEIDPLSTGPANLWDKLDRILNGAAQIPENQAIIEIHQGIAQELPFKSDFFDAVITDPPYYDNLNYSLLADFIYFWKRGLISQLLGRDINKTTRIHQELVASKNIHGSLAHEWFSNGFMKAIKEIERTIKPDGIFSLIYSHKTVMAWDALCFAYQNSNFYIYQVQPLGIERKARPRGMMAKAVNSCLVLIGKKQTQKKFPIPENFIENLVIDHNFVLSLRNNGWDEFDIGLGLFGKCIQQLVQYTPYPVVENRINLITQIVNKINEIVPSFNLDTRTSI